MRESPADESQNRANNGGSTDIDQRSVCLVQMAAGLH